MTAPCKSECPCVGRQGESDDEGVHVGLPNNRNFEGWALDAVSGTYCGTCRRVADAPSSLARTAKNIPEYGLLRMNIRNSDANGAAGNRVGSVPLTVVVQHVCSTGFSCWHPERASYLMFSLEIRISLMFNTEATDTR